MKYLSISGYNGAPQDLEDWFRGQYLVDLLRESEWEENKRVFMQEYPRAKIELFDFDKSAPHAKQVLDFYKNKEDRKIYPINYRF